MPEILIIANIAVAFVAIPTALIRAALKGTR